MKKITLHCENTFNPHLQATLHLDRTTDINLTLPPRTFAKPFLRALKEINKTTFTLKTLPHKTTQPTNLAYKAMGLYRTQNHTAKQKMQDILRTAFYRLLTTKYDIHIENNLFSAVTP